MTEPLRVAVTGASGYVGSRIARQLRGNSLRVIELNRRPSGGDARAFILGEPVRPETLAGIDALVHCAYDFTAAKWRDIERSNVGGSLELLAAARAAGVKKIIFISTLSAFPGCVSRYGRAKLMVEERAGPGAIIVRPGLVHDEAGPGGVVGALGRLAARLPVVPMVGAGRQILHACHSEDLSKLIHFLCVNETATPGPIPAACKTGWRFRDILRAMAAAKGRKPLFVPVPSALLLAALRTVELFGFKSRLRSDSLVSLNNQNPAVDFAPLEATGITFRDFQF